MKRESEEIRYAEDVCDDGKRQAASRDKELRAMVMFGCLVAVTCCVRFHFQERTIEEAHEPEEVTDRAYI